MAALAVAIAGVLALAFPDTARAQAPSPSVCDRTPEVRTKIVGSFSDLSCADITQAQLGTIGAMTLERNGITSLSTGDFNGLSSLGTLVLSHNSLTELPEGIFDDLGNLTILSLSNNGLQTLRGDVFEHTHRLVTLTLRKNALRDLPSGVFNNTRNMAALDLGNNSLHGLPAGIFDRLTRLSTLTIQNNSLTDLRADAFSQLGKLQTLDLSNNPITSLPSGVFSNLGSLNILRMNDMRLQRLPDGVFDDLTALTSLYLHGNSLRSLRRELFRNLQSVSLIQLDNNRLSTLPDRIFEPAGRLQSLCLAGNPGRAGFVPTAISRDARTKPSGAVTLDASGSGGAWGTNVQFRWETEETSVTLVETPGFGAVVSFTAPETPGELELTLHTVGAGDEGLECDPAGSQGYTASTTVTVHVLRTCDDAYNGALRLVNGDVPNEGRLEICIDDGDSDMTNGDGWGVICDDYWTDVEAGVACRQLGYPGGVDNMGRTRDEQGRSLPPLHFGAPAAGVPMWLDNVTCTGSEANLLECPRRRQNQSPGSGDLSYGEHNCRAQEAVGVRCVTSLPTDVPDEPPVAPETAPALTVTPVNWDFLDAYYEAVDVVLEYAVPVSVFTAAGTPALTLRIGSDMGSDVLASYVGGSGSRELLFRYLLPKPFGSPGTVRVVENSLMARGGILRYTAGDTDLPLGHGAAASRPFVVSAPAMALVDVDEDDSFGEGDKVEITLTYNEAVVVDTTDGTPFVGLDFLDSDGDSFFGFLDSFPEAAYASGSGAAALVFSYTMTADDGSPATIDAFANSPKLNGGSISSAATDLEVLSRSPAQSIATASIANSMAEEVAEAPTVVGAPAVSAAGLDGEWTEGETVEVRVTFSAAVNVDTANGTPGIGLSLSGTAARTAAYASGSGSETLVFSYTLSAGDGAHGSMLVAPNSLALNGGTISAGGADADLAHEGAAVLAGPVQGVRDGDEPPPAGFSAAFEGLPDSHDGTGAFGFTLRFSETPDELSYKTVGGGLLALSGAAVTGARRETGGSDIAWIVTAEPAGEGDVSIALPVRACGAANAVCADGRPLARAARATVPVAPLTATLSGMPDEHDGTNPFTFRVSFSAAPEVSYTTVRDTMFAVAGGGITGARRLVAGSNRSFAVTVQPAGDAAVTLALAALPACGESGAVCTAGGRSLRGPLNATVPGPVAISVADASVREGADAVLSFAVTLDRGRHAPVTVDYATADGTATAGEDYRAASGTLAFAAGETEKTVPVAVLDDAHDEGSETMTLRLSNPSGARIADGEATGTIENSDAIPKAWIARFGRTVADQVLDAVDARLRAARTAGASVSLAGQRIGGAAANADGKAAADKKSGAASDGTSASLFGGTAAEDAEDTARLKALSDWLKQETAEDERPNGRSRSLTARQVALGSSFSVAAETDGGGFAALWGRMAQTRFAGREDALSLDGDVTTGLLGADYASGRWTTGLVISHSIGEGGYRGASAGEIEATVTALTPWAGYAVTERVSVWGAAGYGAGGLTLTPEGAAALKTDLGMTLAAAGARGTLVGGEGPTLDAVTDGRWVRTTTARVSSAAGTLASASAEVTRLRLGLEGSWPLALGYGVLGEGATVTPRLALGVRHDGGDAETGFGADIGGGVDLAAPTQGLTVSLEGRGVLTHEAAGLRERGVAGTLAWNPPPPGRGPTLTLSQSFGAGASGGKDALLSRTTLEGLAANDNGAGRRRLEARFGYGFAVYGGGFTMTPEIGLGLSDAGRDYSLGWRLTRTGPGSLELSIDATRRERANDDVAPEHGIGVRLTARF